ncbi:XdhC family protein [Solimonas terrae]|uniref:XdhC family protein n=1 Tax=Solimonas terrae TaxID=1396819 RepID=A0A6M2BRV2_9GAMM|nr:XdhC family protein [Solimonas terrae]NGY04985.1 XdhC family protein [Solimonas terrae]
MADSTSLDGDTALAWPDWPAYALIDDLLPTLQRWVAGRRRYALATLIDVSGSAPRPVGSEMAICEDGEIAGYVSGGCVEAAVATEARAALIDGQPRLLDYGAGSPVLDLQLSCGGRIRILVRAVDDGAAHVAQLQQARIARHPLFATIDLASGAAQYSDRVMREPGLHDAQFIKRYDPPLRLVIVGGDPVALALLRLAPSFGLETALLRPRGPERYPDDEPAPRFYDRRGIDTALAAVQLDARCAIYTVSHDADTDHAVLAHALGSNAFCIGALGSRTKAQQRRERLRADGFDDAALARLHTPAGLNIGARTPLEIALSILGQVVAERGR